MCSPFLQVLNSGDTRGATWNNTWSGIFWWCDSRIEQGWICPKCSRVFSPSITECHYCNNVQCLTGGGADGVVSYQHDPAEYDGGYSKACGEGS